MPQAYYDETTPLTPPVTGAPLTPGEPPAAETLFSFEGYRIEFNEKVMLIPTLLTKPYG